MRNKRKLFTLNCLARKIYSFDLLTSGKLFHFLLLIWLKNISWNHIEVDFWKGFVGLVALEIAVATGKTLKLIEISVAISEIYMEAVLQGEKLILNAIELGMASIYP